MGVDPALILAQLGQGAREAQVIQSAPELAQNASKDVVAQQLQAEQQKIETISDPEKADETKRRVDEREQRKQRREQRRQKRRAARAARLAQAEQTARMATAAGLPHAEGGAPDSQTDEVAGLIIDKSV